MARTQAGRTLTGEHRRAQLQLRAATLRDFVRLWPLWDGDEQTFRRLVDATIPLVRFHRGLSAALAGTYFETFRRAERVAGTPHVVPAEQLDTDKLAASLQVTGVIMTGRALAAGKPAEQAMRTALVRVSGTVTRFALDGGRSTLVQSVQDDRQAQGWARVTDGKPCAFCAMLAARGPAYKGEASADFQAHDHCGCGAEPHYDGAEWPGRGREFQELYRRAQREARASGEGASGTANDALNNFRRLLESA